MELNLDLVSIRRQATSLELMPFLNCLGFPASLACSLVLTLLIGGIQVTNVCIPVHRLYWHAGTYAGLSGGGGSHGKGVRITVAVYTYFVVNPSTVPAPQGKVCYQRRAKDVDKLYPDRQCISSSQ